MCDNTFQTRSQNITVKASNAAYWEYTLHNLLVLTCTKNSHLKKNICIVLTAILRIYKLLDLKKREIWRLHCTE